MALLDCDGNWLHGFMKNIGSGEVFRAEAWGLFTSLQLAKQLDISNLVVDDSSVFYVANLLLIT